MCRIYKNSQLVVINDSFLVQLQNQRNLYGVNGILICFNFFSFYSSFVCFVHLICFVWPGSQMSPNLMWKTLTSLAPPTTSSSSSVEHAICSQMYSPLLLCSLLLLKILYTLKFSSFTYVVCPIWLCLQTLAIQSNAVEYEYLVAPVLLAKFDLGSLLQYSIDMQQSIHMPSFLTPASFPPFFPPFIILWQTKWYPRRDHKSTCPESIGNSHFGVSHSYLITLSSHLSLFFFFFLFSFDLFSFILFILISLLPWSFLFHLTC